MNSAWIEVTARWQGKYEPAKAVVPLRVEVVTDPKPPRKAGVYVYLYSPQWGYRWIERQQIKWKNQVPTAVSDPPQSPPSPPSPKDTIEVNRKLLQQAHQLLQQQHLEQAALLYQQILENSPNPIQKSCCESCLLQCQPTQPTQPKSPDWRKAFLK